MRALVIGYGSIGSRHARLLAGMGLEVGAITRVDQCPFPNWSDIGIALHEFSPEYVIVSNATEDHFDTLDTLDKGGFHGKVLVEKPLVRNAFAPRIWGFESLHIAYNLRFHPVVAALRKELAGDPPIAAEIHCGQFLPDWRPGRDYRHSYSASLRRGGGVLRDLSHELDYALWIFGPWRRVAAIGGHVSLLEIESDDAWSLLIEGHRCPMLTLHVNYLNRIPRREIHVVTQKNSYSADLLVGTLSSLAGKCTFPVNADDTYLAEHRAVLSGGESELCTEQEALHVLRLIEGIELAAASGQWVSTK